jgi:hypothetical protein
MTEMVAVIMKKFPLAPALARQQIAKMAVVITTIRPMPALVLTRYQKAMGPAIIASTVIMTTHPMSGALMRHQMAEGLVITLAMGPHLKGLQHASKHTTHQG